MPLKHVLSNTKYLAGKAARKQAELFISAVKVCKEENIGAKACVARPEFGELGWRALHRRLNGEVTTGREAESTSLLTHIEEKQLCDWIRKCGANMKGQCRQQVAEKVVEILRERHARNRGATGKKYQKLSQVAKTILEQGPTKISKHWFQRFYGYWHYEISEKLPEPVDKARVATYTENTVHKHFFGLAGLRATLLNLGIMDPMTNEIDMTRVFNRDEMGQFIDYAGGKKGGQKVGCAANVPAKKAAKENRETATLDMVQNGAGMLFGMHLIVARSTLTESFAVEELAAFDKKIHELEGYSTFGLVSLTDCGVQTGVTLLERYKLFDEELTAAGIKRPVLELTDNHLSRYSDEVMAYCEEKDIHQFSEPAKSSGFLQALDQNMTACHNTYNKSKDNMKRELAVGLTIDGINKERQRVAELPEADQAAAKKLPQVVVGPEEVTLGLTECVQICSKMWFSWSTKLDRITTFAKVGITSKGLAPWLINRTHFVVAGALDRTYDLVTGESCASNSGSVATHASTRKRRSGSGESVTMIPVMFNPGSTTPERIPPPHIDEMETPPSAKALRKGTAGYLQKMLGYAVGNARDWSTYQTNPVAVKLLDPLTIHAVKSKQGKKQKLSDLNGSFQCNRILELSSENTEAKEKALEVSAATKQTAADKAAAKKSQDLANNVRKSALNAQLFSTWTKCGVKCTCACKGFNVFVHNKRVPCPAKGLKFCEVCKDIKKSACKKQACLAAAELEAFVF